MSKIYLVKLTPHDKFFFGGETTFGEGNVNYFVKSNYFPQQTSLLGLIRYQLLRQSKNGIFKNNKILEADKAAKLIGEESYKFGNGFNFGAIKNLSPVFITNENGDNYFTANKEYQWVVVDKETKKEINNFVFRQFNKIKKGSSVITVGKDFIPKLEKYEAKDGLPDLLIDNSLSIRYYDYKKETQNSPFNGVFIEHRQVGIRKNYKGKTEDKAFYVQSFYRLKKGYSFAFILELDDEVNFSTNELVTLGGEQSKFRMEVIKYAKEFRDILPQYESSKNVDKVVLVSDAYVSNKIFVDCDFAVTDTIDFRSIKSTKNTTNYSSMDRTGIKTDELSKTDKYNFFKRGSVFYGEETSKIVSHLNSSDNNNNDKSPLQKIGYNNYKIVNKKEV